MTATAIAPTPSTRPVIARSAIPARRWRYIQPVVVIIAGFLVLNVVQPAAYDLRIFTLVVIYALASVGLNVLVGFTGVVSIANAMFLAIGGYAWARLAESYGPGVALIAGVVIAIAVAAVVGLLLLRLEAYYFAVATLALGSFATVVMRNWTSVTNSDAGLIGLGFLPVPGLTAVQSIFMVGVILLALCLFLQETLRTSALGLSMLATRFDPPGAQSLGIGVSRARMMAFAFSALTAALGGALIAQLAGGVFPDQFSITQSISLLVIPIIGGRGWRWSTIVGAIVVIALPEYLRFLDEYRLVAYGVLVTLVALFIPGGARQLVTMSESGGRRIQSYLRTRSTSRSEPAHG